MTSQNELVVPSIRSSDVDDKDDDDVEEVTETMIIGVTEKGVIRKRSIKRKLTKEEKFKRGYGSDKAEYARIAEQVMAERIFSGTMEGLRERLKMLEFMHTDCMDMVDQCMKRRKEMMRERKSKNADVIIVLFLAATVFLGACWIIKIFIW